MPAHYLYRCTNCSYRRTRYRNIKNCPVCHSPLKRVYAVQKVAQLTEAQSTALDELAKSNGYNWSEFCRALADGRFWPLEPKDEK